MQMGQVTITWLADSGVRMSLLSEKDWEKLTKVNTQLRLKRNKKNWISGWWPHVTEAMGVLGLCTLLEPAGKPVPVES